MFSDISRRLPKGLAARAVIETGCGESKLYIEVWEGNRFSNFYHTYIAVGRGRIVTPDIPRHRGLADSTEDAVEKILKAIKAHVKRSRTEVQIHTTVRVYRKRLYRKLLYQESRVEAHWSIELSILPVEEVLKMHHQKRVKSPHRGQTGFQ